jgi:hypothetical protein
VICDNCNRSCSCPRRVLDGEAKVAVKFSVEEIEYLLGNGSNRVNVYELHRRLEQALGLFG